METDFATGNYIIHRTMAGRGANIITDDIKDPIINLTLLKTDLC